MKLQLIVEANENFSSINWEMGECDWWRKGDEGELNGERSNKKCVWRSMTNLGHKLPKLVERGLHAIPPLKNHP